ncbi:uroporphyrinogen-III C-methyltransferase [Leptospira perolatii]|uniref:uroporphyrinogen-III C-methyltransferase n=1 Tax=Leptospira perolatii TaxID=2023191 RepID=A0A2M9ZRM6_9LEPT|nr:uroporphyrinogen-III C-methyltransferase [Leptospira perolatii]PJZ71203.1 uroporphyrinogen-III C-methyltransferase [Leptospira perolatii]PJZ74736.1 uroporphyrinogen-III C-methyltransferase [Leptospira perolatii]
MRSFERKVYLVGAGPGDPDLLTVKAVKVLRKAQVVLYDDLVSAKVLRLCRKSAELIYVGKRIGQHSCAQQEINEKIAEAASQYDIVVRLKGGDPAIFARVGEEFAYLLSLGIDCEIVAGVTTASGAAASLGIPLTHRDYAREIVFLSGHKKDGKNSEGFRDLVCAGKTLIVYMGLNSLETITKELLNSQNPEDTPIAIIENATLESERILTGNLGNILELASKNEVRSPALLVIGGIVRFYIEMEALRKEARQQAFSI